jgi:sugar lactone lactonase YvrE
MWIRSAVSSLAILIFMTGASLQAQWPTGQPLTEVYSNNQFQLTGISVSKSGRLFVNFPRWSDRYLNAVVEVMPDGTTKPFPDEYWNRWDLKIPDAGKQFVCVQSVVVDDTDALWVLDPAAPLLASVVPGGAKLVKIDLTTNQVVRVISFSPDVANASSYLNDVRFDTKNNVAYITDSGNGGIVVVDLNTGNARRTLDGDPSVMVEQGVGITIGNKQVLGPSGQPPMFNSDSLALSPDGAYVYYKAVTARSLYRIKTSVLRDATASPQAVSAAVEKVATIFPTDGFWMDSKGRLYLTALEQNGVSRLLPNGTLQSVVVDPRLDWPDTFTEGPDGFIYVSASHINESPTYNQGRSVRRLPYGVFKFKPQ